MAVFSSNAIGIITLSSLVFGIAHLFNNTQLNGSNIFNWKLFVLTFVGGLYLGFAYFATGSLVLPIFIHTLFGVAIILFIKK